jgi:hypothetical protein
MARKTQELRPTMVRLPANLRRELERVAELHERSLSAEMIYRLEQSLLSEDPKGGPERSVGERLTAIEKTLETFWRILKAQQKVTQDAIGALTKATTEAKDK